MNANLAPMPEKVNKNAGRSWPLKVNYQKVEKNVRDFQKNSKNAFNKNTEQYDGISKKKIGLPPQKKEMGNIGENAYVIDEAQMFGQIPDGPEASPFYDKTRGAPIKGAKYAQNGMNRDQMNIDI